MKIIQRLFFLALILISATSYGQDTLPYTVISYPTPQITIPISDVVVNNTIVKRKATLFTMIYNQQSKTLSLSWTVNFFANNNGEYGESISNIAPSYTRETIADNTTLVNLSTGAILDNPTGNVMGQYDWFFMIATTQPIIVNDMIRQYGLNVTNWDKR